MLPILGLAAAMPAVGQARAAGRRDSSEYMSERILYGTKTTVQANKPAAQIRLARAEIEARQAELLLRHVSGRNVMALRDRASRIRSARAGSPPTPSPWTRANACFSPSPKRAVPTRTSRVIRCSAPCAMSNTMASHAIFDLDSRLENLGRTMLGLEPEGII